MLGPAGKIGVDPRLLHELLHPLHGSAQELQSLLLLPGNQTPDALILLRHEILEGQVLQLAS